MCTTYMACVLPGVLLIGSIVVVFIAILYYWFIELVVVDISLEVFVYLQILLSIVRTKVLSMYMQNFKYIYIK